MRTVDRPTLPPLAFNSQAIDGGARRPRSPDPLLGITSPRQMKNPAGDPAGLDIREKMQAISPNR